MSVPIWFKPELCQTLIYKKDQLRRTGRGKYGFEMHYTQDQCSRKAKYGQFCFQHKIKAEAKRVERN